jgi:hypothetical protein
MGIEKLGFADRCKSGLVARPRGKSGALFSGRFDVECFDKDGNLKWKDYIENIVTNEGLNHILDILFVSATAQVDPWYVGLIDATPSPAAGDTAAGIDTSAQVWGEVQTYDEAVRQTYTDVRTAQSVDNSASKAVFTISGSVTVGGAFMISDSTKGGTSGTLLCAGAFTGGNRAVVDNDTLNVTYTFTAADDGA